MKAVIPVAGIGTKLRPHTHTQPKPLIPVAGKPILGHIIDNLIEAGITEYIFIIGYLREKIREYVQTHYADKISMEFVVQAPRKGLAHALWMAKEYLGEDEILVNLGDTIFGADTSRVVQMPGSVLCVQEVDKPREFGIAQLGEDGHVIKVVEKPEIPTSNLALVGLYKIDQMSVLMEALTQMFSEGLLEEHDYSLTEALMSMINLGTKFQAYHVESWYDCGRKAQLLLANRILLSEFQEDELPQFENTVIIPPVKIAEGCQIKDSIVGPNVAIAEHSVINHSILSNSILGAYTQLESIILKNSVIGNDTSLKGRSNSINIGDNTELDFGS
ncbi:sugar phosphate nucleotidyltransferase [Pontibacter sp. G13]|uniref:sugar phosphate nucleotidyltransferase n=1 Tax=Pontibacter sp. G13 TaxID=3074898 RepID=UPI00288A2586|nr:sugar phosphate nucleotidyltransferase [Pontibacter sp. G13]WNJ18049.1 sugar phosphate nucleotidyltransferase [Pontibacter sp. G13]